VILDAGGSGTAIVLKSDDITLEHITIRGTGHRKEVFDSAIKGEHLRNITVKNCKIYDALYGIDLAMAEKCAILSNTISSKAEKIPHRGDAIKFWYVNHSTIRDNTFLKARDIHLSRSSDNTIQNNRFLQNRFATFIEFGKNNLIEGNLYRYNETAILLEGTKNIRITGNRILSSRGVAGIGAVLRGGKEIVFENNVVKFNAKGLYIDAKPAKAQKPHRIITKNEISYNIEAIHFHAIISNNQITYNRIHHNVEDIVKDITDYKNSNNTVAYNYWGQYRGFDKNGDNIGDTPYVIKRYFDKLYGYDNKIRFFYGSVVMALADFMCEIAPFTEPEIILEDRKPLMRYE
jgi:nitrous oxidase accessory protein